MKKIKCAAVFALLVVMAVFSSCGGKSNKSCVMVSINRSDYQDDVAIMVYSYIEQALSSRGDINILDRTKFEEMSAELGFQQSDWSNVGKTAQIGNALNGDMLCFVNIYNKQYSIEFVNVNTSKKKTFNGKYSISLIGKTVKVKGLFFLKRMKISDLFGV